MTEVLNLLIKLEQIDEELLPMEEQRKFENLLLVKIL